MPGVRGGGARGSLPKLYGGAQPVATITLIAINIVVFLLERGGDSSTYVFRKGALTGIGVANGEWWRVGTAAFLHANVLHILFNMYALWLLGRALERYIGIGALPRHLRHLRHQRLGRRAPPDEHVHRRPSAPPARSSG